MYTKESLGYGNVPLFFTSINYFLFGKLPKRNIEVNNKTMGAYKARAFTTDFMYSFYAYEYKVKDAILAIVNDYDTYIDIGACIGDYSIWLAKKGLKVYAFEPVHENFNQLEYNVKLNGLNHKIDTVNKGLGNKKETLHFSVHPENKGYSSRYLKTENATEDDVLITTLDLFASSRKMPLDHSYIIKIDVEGMELEVLKGATYFLRHVKKAFIIFESWSGKNDIIEGLKEIVDFELVQLDDLNCAAIIKN